MDANGWFVKSITPAFLMTKMNKKIFQVFDEEDNNPSIPLFASVADGFEYKKSLVRKDSGKF